MEDIKTKICKECKTEKPASEFSPHKKYKDGLNSQCKVCRNNYKQKWRHEGFKKRIPIADGKKLCKDCNETKDIELFIKSTKTKSGIGHVCRVCHNIREQSRKEKYKQEGKVFKKPLTREQKDNYNEYKREWRLENPDYDKQQYEKRKIKDPEGLKEKQLINGRNNYIKTKNDSKRWANLLLKNNNRKHLMRTLERDTDITKDWLLELKNKTPYCSITGMKLISKPYQPNSRHLDHIIPINIGGKHVMSNVRYISLKANLERPPDGSDLLQPYNYFFDLIFQASKFPEKLISSQIPLDPEFEKILNELL